MINGVISIGIVGSFIYCLFKAGVDEYERVNWLGGAIFVLLIAIIAMHPDSTIYPGDTNWFDQ